MAFEPLMNKPMPEINLLKKVIAYIQKNYSKLSSQCYFIKLATPYPYMTQMTWVKNFDDVYKLGDYYFNTKFHRTCIMVKFDKDKYEILFEGYNIYDRIKVWPGSISEIDPILTVVNCEEVPMISHELLHYAFGEITEELQTKGNKSV